METIEMGVENRNGKQIMHSSLMDSLVCFIITLVFYTQQWLYDWLHELCALALLLYCALIVITYSE